MTIANTTMRAAGVEANRRLADIVEGRVDMMALTQATLQDIEALRQAGLSVAEMLDLILSVSLWLGEPPDACAWRAHCF